MRTNKQKLNESYNTSFDPKLLEILDQFLVYKNKENCSLIIEFEHHIITFRDLYGIEFHGRMINVTPIGQRPLTLPMSNIKKIKFIFGDIYEEVEL